MQASLRIRAFGLALGSAFLVAGALLSACGGGDEEPKQPTATPAATTPPSGPGTITVRSTAPIRGQNGRALLVYVTREGQAPLARACIMIGSDSFAVPATKMTDVPSGNDPCAGTTAATTFAEGRYTLTAAIYAPPAQTPDKQATLTVEVKGNVEVVIDGGALSR